MRSCRLVALVFGVSVLLAAGPDAAQAQTSSSGTSTSGSSSLLSSSSSSGSSSSGGASSGQTISGVGAGLVTSAQTVSALSQTPSATSIPSNANVLGTSYVNYFTLGMPQNYQGKFGAQNVAPNITGTFGKYIYVANPSTTSGTASTTPTQGTGFSTFGQPRAPVYSTSFARDLPVIRPSVVQVQTGARDAIALSTALKSTKKGSIQVAMNGSVVVLNGSVGSETDRTVAEGLVRMTPGVGDVLNNLVVEPNKE